MRTLLRSMLLLGFLAAPSLAVPTYTEKVFIDMKAALEPDRPSVRKLVFTISTQGEPARWLAYQLRKGLPDGKRTLTVFVEPESVKGVALLTTEQKDQPPVDFVYLPTVRRLLKNPDLEALQLLYSDFTFADIGVLKLGESQLTLLGAEQRAGKRTMKVQEVPRAPRPYTRVLTWVAADAPLPIDREFYDVTDTLLKTAHFDFTDIDGVPTLTRKRIENKVDTGSTELQVSDIRYDLEIPDNLLDPARLSQVADDPFWQLLVLPPTPVPPPQPEPAPQAEVAPAPEAPPAPPVN